MRKIMLVVDDFKEMVALETFFRRVGFDVLSLGKDILVNDALLRFTPDLVIATAKGRAVEGTKLALKMKKLSPAPRVALLIQQGGASAVNEETRSTVDAVLETPFQPRQALVVVGKLLQLDSAPLLAKYEKITTAKLKTETEMMIVSDDRSAQSSTPVTGAQPNARDDAGSVFAAQDLSSGEGSESEPSSLFAEWDPVKTPGQATVARSGRTDRYAKFLAEHASEPVERVLPHEALVLAAKQLKKVSEPEKRELEALDESKREFAKALFREGAGVGRALAKVK